MDGECKFEITKGMVVPAAQMLPVSFLYALGSAPIGDLIIADNGCARPFGNRDGITHVVAMAMANKDEIRCNGIRRGRGSRIAAEEWINNKFVAARFEPEGGM